MQAADGAEASEGQGDALLCPAALCEPGAVLVGMIGADGRVGYVLPQVPVSERFVAFARTSGAPERRFRFASPCVEGACRHWCAGRCTVIDRVAATIDPREAAGPVAVALPVPRCGIRAECRWFDQLGLDACAVCPFVVTERRTRDGPADAARDVSSPRDEEQRMGPYTKVDHAPGAVREAPDVSGATPRAGVVSDDAAPISGISLERYAQLCKALGERGLEGAAVVAFLAQQGHTRIEWETATDGWNARMEANAALSTRFGALYRSSPLI